ncbi:hypothetical protein POF51_29715 [Brevibacillus sp. AG]|uniref:hypothetical protein n=1 Tax=Brevibacillus sp. AG TaxID=3020891 RepID=UPI002331304E|nr:hypothetical protein [Brevibacillus sp. AG]MDC0764902.1 hypothetical protein [Brevibacillus sp. AG]
MSANTALKPNNVALPYYQEIMEKEAKQTEEFLQQRTIRAAEIMARVGIIPPTTKKTT